MSHEKLARMANQIAAFFATQPGTGQADRVAAHLRDFWDPRMRAQFLDLAGQAGNGLSPLAAQAAEKLRSG